MMINSIAPNFTSQAVIDGKIATITLHELKSEYTVLFFYPLDFTFVCPTELHALQENIDQFRKIGAEVLAISVDSVYSHLAWAEIPRKRGGIAGVSYPLIADLTKDIARNYDVLDVNAGVAYRATYILDKEKRIQHVSINNLPLGRNIAEILRIVQALQVHNKEGVVCPANWTENDTVMVPTKEGVLTYFSE